MGAIDDALSDLADTRTLDLDITLSDSDKEAASPYPMTIVVFHLYTAHGDVLSDRNMRLLPKEIN